MRQQLSGVVTVNEGQPARHATIELHNSTGDIVDQVVADDSGRFNYYLSAGTWTLVVWDPFGHRTSTQVYIEQGETKNIELELIGPEGVPSR